MPAALALELQFFVFDGTHGGSARPDAALR